MNEEGRLEPVSLSMYVFIYIYFGGSVGGDIIAIDFCLRFIYFRVEGRAKGENPRQTPCREWSPTRGSTPQP